MGNSCVLAAGEAASDPIVDAASHAPGRDEERIRTREAPRLQGWRRSRASPIRTTASVGPFLNAIDARADRSCDDLPYHCSCRLASGNLQRCLAGALACE
jgi:hypothetical protein